MSDTGNLPTGPVPDGQLRVGDAERHQAAMALGEHFATGRLDQQEFDDRVQAAYAARTRTDLQRLFDDLPEPAPFRVTTAPVATPVQAPPRRMPLFVPVLPLLLVVALVVLISRGVAPFPLLFVFIWLCCGLGRRAHRGPHRYASRRSW
jgi:Domain of unknown function (DUF1707)